LGNLNGKTNGAGIVNAGNGSNYANRLTFTYFNNDTDSLEQYPIYSEYTLLPESKQAIAKAPKWLRKDLYNVLSRVNELHQPEWASAINDAEDPYIDEIAFAIAHISPEYLSANVAGDLYGSAELIMENAEMIYNNAQYLDYVEVVDYGSSTTDEDYYSTTRYKKVNAADDTVQVEVPKEIFIEDYPARIETVGDLLRKTRLDQGLTIEELQEIIGVFEGSIINTVQK